MDNRFGWLALLVVASLAAGSPALAGSGKDREREAVRRVQQQMQQMQGQLSTLEQEKASLTENLAESEKAAKAAQGKAGRLDRELKQERERREALEKELAATKEQLDKTQTSLDETSRTLATTEAEKKRLEAIKALREKEIALCEDKNKTLYQLGRDLMARFEQKSCGEILAQKEPFSGLKRVDIENLLEEYRDKLDEQKIIKPPGG
ncbi:MAG: hypothetical protein HXY26_09465 [Hydrogenophilaceae bacterium]|nr:hypothetical protein [Hydrogenophilaceae bacterium]